MPLASLPPTPSSITLGLALAIALASTLACPIEIVEGDRSSSATPLAATDGEPFETDGLDDDGGRWREVWRAVADDLGDAQPITGRSVAVLDDGSVAFLARAHDGSSDHIGVLTEAGLLLWARPLPFAGSGVTASPAGHLAVAGDRDGRAALALYLADGAQRWSTIADCLLSTHTDLGFAGDETLAVVGVCNDGFLARYAADEGRHQQTQLSLLFTRFDALSRAPNGHLRAVGREVDGSARVVDFDPELIAAWSSRRFHGPAAGAVDLATDADGNSYLLAVDEAWLPYVAKLDGAGNVRWLVSLSPGRRAAIAALPERAGVVIVGSQGPTAVVEQLDPDGLVVTSHSVAAGPIGYEAEHGASQWLTDVAVTPDGELVAIGGTRELDGDGDLLVVKLAPTAALER